MTDEVTAQAEPAPEDTSPVIVDEVPVAAEAAAEEAPVEEVPVEAEAPKLRVRSRKVAEGVVLAEQPAEVPDVTTRSDGETRTTTEPGPVQLANVRAEPREVDEINLPSGLSITRERY